MAVPTRPTTHLIVIEADFTLGSLKATLNGPATARDPHQLLQRRCLGCKHHISRHRLWIAHTPLHQQPPAPARLQGLSQGQPAPVIPPRTFRAIARTAPRPAVVRQGSQDGFDPPWLP